MKKARLVISIVLIFIIIFSCALSARALHGDLNYDDSITLQDAITALRFATGIEVPDKFQEHSADLNYDGEITTEDARLILRGAANMDYIPDHLFSEWETVTPSTCTEKGVAKCYCLYCGKEVTRSLPEAEHALIPATCERPSYCAGCLEAFGEPTAHNNVDGQCTECGKLLLPPVITYNSKEIEFGISAENIKKALGEPKNQYTDTNTAEAVQILVYYTDYKDLGVFTFVNGGLTQFFTNSATARVSHEESHYGLYCKSAPHKIGEVSITAYSDTFNNSLYYSFCATVGESYNLTRTTSYAVNEMLNFHLTNGLRAINGVAPLTYCDKTSAVARGHSTDMATRNYFDHPNPEGNRVGERLTAAGIKWAYSGENIVAGYYDPYDIANGWYNSEGHRKNILNSKYKYLGVGFAYNEKSTYKYYGTQNFYTDQY